jgi:hypothetical protein
MRQPVAASPYRTSALARAVRRHVVLDYRTHCTRYRPESLVWIVVASVLPVWLAAMVSPLASVLLFVAVFVVAFLVAAAAREVVLYDGAAATLAIIHVGLWRTRTACTLPIDEIADVDERRSVIRLRLTSGAFVPLPPIADENFHARAIERLRAFLANASSSASAPSEKASALGPRSGRPVQRQFNRKGR